RCRIITRPHLRGQHADVAQDGHGVSRAKVWPSDFWWGPGLTGRGQELLVAQRQTLRVRAVRGPRREGEALPVHLLESVTQHRAVDFLRQTGVDAHLEIGRDP